MRRGKEKKDPGHASLCGVCGHMAVRVRRHSSVHRLLLALTAVPKIAIYYSFLTSEARTVWRWVWVALVFLAIQVTLYWSAHVLPIWNFLYVTLIATVASFLSKRKRTRY